MVLVVRIAGDDWRRAAVEPLTIKDAEYTYALMMNWSSSLGVNCTFCHSSRAFQNWESSTPNYEKILRVGLKGILEEVRQRQVKLEEQYMAETMTGIDYVRKRDELDAMALSLEAAIIPGLANLPDSGPPSTKTRTASIMIRRGV